MTVDAPIVGERVTYDWAVAVADAINDLASRMAPDALKRLATDESTNVATVSSISGWEVTGQPIGRSLAITGRVDYSCANTNQGLGIGFRHPGGVGHGIFRTFGVTAGDVEAIDRLSTNTANNDEMTSRATVSTGGGRFICEFTLFVTLTTGGTVTIRKRLNGTPGSTGLTIYQGSFIRVVAVD
jgi:hypothetical protein